MTSKVTYTGELRTSCVHLRSGDSFITDAPVDNNGLGQAFSPTDTVATGLASCILTMMGMKARGLEVDLSNSTAEVTKHMASDPRRIVKIEIELKLPANVSEKNRKILIHTANTCPVHYSLHPDIEKSNHVQLGIIRYILVFAFLGLTSFQSLQDYETITWTADKRLSWKDFRGKAPSNDRAAATTASGITYRFSTSGTNDNIEVDFKIDTYFYPTKSWYQPELCDEVILSHEQLHFDISELYARELRKRLDAATFTHSNVKAKVRTIYRKINEELSEFQNRYDAETNFSRDREQQVIWNKEITKALKSK